MDVYQCPDCELRFRFAAELEEHIAREHPNFHAEIKSGDASPFAAAHHRRHKRTAERMPRESSH